MADKVIHRQEEQYRKIELAQAGDKAAEEELLQSNMGLVHTVARRMASCGVEYEDLCQLGCVGLLKAIRNFDLKRGVCFSTFAVPMILGEMRRYIRDNGSIKVSRSIKELSVKILRKEQELTAKLGRSPSFDELYSCFDGVDYDTFMLASEACRPVLSLSSELDDSSGDKPLTLSDCIGEDFRESILENITLRQTIDSLDEMSKAVVFLRYFSGKTQSETANILGVSQVKISRMEKKILQILRNGMRER